MTLDQWINVCVTLALAEMMVALGLGVALSELVDVIRNGRLVTRAMLANYVCFPAITVGLLVLFDPHPMVAAGFLTLAVCPGAPYGPPFTAIAQGNVAVAVGLMVLLAASSAVVAPLLLSYLLPWLSSAEPLHLSATRIAGTLLATQLLPLCAGLALRQWRPHIADLLLKPAILLSKILNLAAVGLIVVGQWHLLLEIRSRGLVGMLTLLVAGMAVGWLSGGRTAGTRKAMAVTTSLRNFGVGLVIATGAFAGTPAVTAVVAYGLVSLVGTLTLAAVAGTRQGMSDPAHRPVS